MSFSASLSPFLAILTLKRAPSPRMSIASAARVGPIHNIVLPFLHLGWIRPGKTVFLVCDIQEKFRPHVVAFDSCIHVANTLVRPSALLFVIFRSLLRRLWTFL